MSSVITRVQTALTGAFANLYDGELQSLAEGLKLQELDDRQDIIDAILGELARVSIGESNVTTTVAEDGYDTEATEICSDSDETDVPTGRGWYTTGELSEMSVKDLRILAKEHNLKSTGPKTALLKALLDVPFLAYCVDNRDNMSAERPDYDEGQLMTALRREFAAMSAGQQVAWSPPR